MPRLVILFNADTTDSCVGFLLCGCTTGVRCFKVPGGRLGSSAGRGVNSAPGNATESARRCSGTQQRADILGRRRHRREIVERSLCHGNDVSLDEGGTFLGSCFRML
jgi:hypothetical protein